MARDPGSHRLNIMARTIAVTIARDLGSDSNKTEGLRRIRVASLMDHQSANRDACFNLHGHGDEGAKREKVIRMLIGNHVQHV